MKQQRKNRKKIQQYKYIFGLLNGLRIILKNVCSMVTEGNKDSNLKYIILLIKTQFYKAYCCRQHVWCVHIESELWYFAHVSEPNFNSYLFISLCSLLFERISRNETTKLICCF